MQVKINKDGKQEVYELINSWADVTLDSWVKLMEFKQGSKTDEAVETISLLSTMPKELIKELALSDVAGIMSRIAAMQENPSNELHKIFVIEGVEYGFHPNLDELTLGEYADLETFIKDMQNNLPQIMAVLFRPVVKKKKDRYTIESYDGNIEDRAEVFGKMKAEQVQNALVFFWNLGSVLSMIMPSYLMEQTQAILTTLQTTSSLKSGGGSV